MKYLLMLLVLSFSVFAQVPKEQVKKSEVNSWVEKIRLVKEVRKDDFKRIMNLAHSIVLELDKPSYTKDEKDLLLAEVLKLYSKIIQVDSNSYVIEFIYDYYLKNKDRVQEAVNKNLSSKDKDLFLEHIQAYKRLKEEGNG